MKTTTTAIQQSQKHNRKQQHTDTHIYTHTCFASSCLSVVVLSPRCVGGFFLSAVSSTRSRVWRGTEWGGTSTPARGYIVSLREKTKKIYEGVDNVGGRRGVGGGAKLSEERGMQRVGWTKAIRSRSCSSGNYLASVLPHHEV